MGRGGRGQHGEIGDVTHQVVGISRPQEKHGQVCGRASHDPIAEWNAHGVETCARGCARSPPTRSLEAAAHGADVAKVIFQNEGGSVSLPFELI